MNKKIIRWCVVCLVSVLTACVQLPAKKQSTDGRPAWIENPGSGVSASATTHVRGRVWQEDLAIARAREEYAKRFGVKIESEMVTTQQVANQKASTTSGKVTTESVSQEGVKGQIKAKWLDPQSDTLWVWLVPAGG